MQVLAMQSKCAYTRFHGGGGVLLSMMKKARSLSLPQSPKVLQLKLGIIIASAMQLMFTRSLSLMVKEKAIFVPYFEPENGFTCADVDSMNEEKLKKLYDETTAQLNKVVDECILEMKNIQKFEIFVLHIDECQSWLTSNSQFSKNLNALVDNSNDLDIWTVITFTQLLQGISRSVRFAFTGTTVNVERVLRFDSGLKVFDKSFGQLPRLNVQQVKQVLNVFIAVNDVEEDIIQQLVGPPRILQYFLKRIYNNEPADTACNNAYNAWECNNTGEAIWELDSYLMDTLILFYFNYQLFGGTMTKDGKIKISTKVFGSEWTTILSRKSLISFSLEGPEEYLISLPFPFLAKLMRQKSQYFDFDVYKQLYSQNYARWLDAPKGRGYIYQFAITLELQCKDSPLLAYIIKSIQERQEYADMIVLDDQAMHQRIHYFNNDDDVESQIKDHRISISIDNDPKTTKCGDISFPLLLSPLKKMLKVRGEAKLYGYGDDSTTSASQARSQCVDFFMKAEKDPNIDVAIFFCWMSMDLDAKTQGKVLKEVKNYLANKNKIFLVIDDMKSMKFILNFPGILEPTKDLEVSAFGGMLFRSKSETSLKAAQTIEQQCK